MATSQSTALRRGEHRGRRRLFSFLAAATGGWLICCLLFAFPGLSRAQDPEAEGKTTPEPMPPAATTEPAAAEPSPTGQWREIRTFEDQYAKLTREQKSALAALITQIKQTGKAPDAGTEEAKQFSMYINWRLGKLTLLENLTLPAKPQDTATGLARLRKEYRTELRTLGTKEDKTAHDQINARALTFLRAVAFNTNFKGEPLGPPLFHPAVRANALIVVGYLNEREPDASGGVKSAVPYSDSLGVLIDAIDKAKTKGVPAADLLAAAAMPGILRHAEAGVGTTHRDRLVGSLVTLVAMKQPPAGRSVEGHMWLRRRAADVLGAMAKANSTAHEPRVVQALAGLLAEHTEGLAPEFALEQRCDAAHALGQFDLATIPGANTRQPAESVALLVAEVVANPPTSVQMIKHYLHPAMVAVSGPGTPADRPKKRGLAAAIAAAPDSKDKSFVTDLQKQIDDMWGLIDVKDMKDTDVPTKLGPKAKEFQQWLAKAAPKALEPATKPADDGKLPTDDPKTGAAKLPK